MAHLHLSPACLLACWAFFHLAVAYPSAGVAQENLRTVDARDLAGLRDISGLSISPDGKWMAFEIIQADAQRNRYDTAWYVMAIGARTARRLADAGELLASMHRGRVVEYLPPPDPMWSPDGAWLVFVRRNSESTQLWRVRRDGGHAEQLTHTAADVREAVYARDGRRLLFETEPSRAQIQAALAEEGRSGFRYDERFQPIYERTPVLPRDASFAGGPRFTRDEVSARQIWVYEFSTRRERPASEAEQAEFTALSSPGRPEGRAAFRGRSARSAGGALAWTEARDPERQGSDPPLTIVAQPAGAPEAIVCAAENCTADRVGGLWWSSEEEIIFIRREGLRLQDRALYVWRPKEPAAPRLILRTPDLFGSRQSSAPGCAPAPGQLICLYEKPNYPGRLVAIDLRSGAVRTLYDPNPDFARFDLGPAPQRIAIRADSGADTYGYVVLPPHRRAGERVPLVVVTYRCSGFLRGGVGDEYPVYPFAANGFAVLCYDLPDDIERRARADSQSYIAWERGAGAPMRRRIEQTLAAAIVQLDQAGVIDPDRVAVTGLSYGAEIVGFALPHLPRLTAAIASSHPGPGLRTYPLVGSAVRALWRTQGVSTPEETPQRWLEIGFTPHIARIRAPLLINAADREMLAALDPVTALEDAGRAVEMYIFPDEYHVKWQPAHRLAIYHRNIDWLNFWLRGVEDKAPEKAAQYERWRVLRGKQCGLFNGTATPWYCRAPSAAPPH